MKKTILLSLCLCLFVGIKAFAWDEVVDVDGFSYLIDKSTHEAAITDRRDEVKYKGDVVIPDRIFYNNTQYNVTEIDYYAFEGCTELTSVVIGIRVREIGNHAFEGCSRLTSIVIPDAVTTIGGSALRNCTRLKSITIGKGVNSFPYIDTFYGCESLESITVSADNTTYNSQGNCNAIIETATKKMILGCKNTACIGNSVTSIGEYAFGGQTKLYNYTLTSYVTYVAPNAFDGCSGLGSISVMDDNPVYDSRNNCNAIIETATNTLVVGCNKTIFPESVTTIGEYAFSGILTCSTFVIPEGITSIGKYAFWNCPNLKTVVIPSTITRMGEWAFGSLSNLNSVFCFCTSVPEPIENSSYWDYNKDGFLYVLPSMLEAFSTKQSWGGKFGNISTVTADKRVLIDDINYQLDFASETATVVAKEPKYTGEVNLPETIGGGIGFSVKSINAMAFRNCTGLTSIEIPFTVTTVGYNAFSGCTSLESASISCKNVGSWFANCASLQRVTLHGVETIGDYALAGCSNLSSVKFNGLQVTSIGEYAFQECTGLFNITIPNSVKSIGRCAFNDCTLLRSITLPNHLTSIEFGLFENCRNLLSINIPSSVKSIGAQAFLGCRSLTSVTFPEGMERIDANAFYECSNLASVFIPRSVTNIDGAFDECNKLTSVSVDNETPIPLSVPTFSNRANATLYVPLGSAAAYAAAPYWQDFKNIVTNAFVIDDIAYELDEVAQTAKVIAKEGGYEGEIAIRDTIDVRGAPYVVTSIGNEAFKGCTSLTSVSLSNTVASIGSSAFSGCTGLTAIDIKEGLESIGANAFYQCSSLAAITLPESLTTLGSTVFRGCNALTSVTIPGNVTSLGSYLFQQCEGLKEAKLSEGLTGTGVATFWRCSNLESVSIPSTLTKIDMLTFDGTAITHIIIPEGVTSIGGYAFNSCKRLNAVTIPSTVTEVQSGAFAGCTGLAIICCYAENTPEVGEYAFNNVEVSRVTLGVPDNSIGAYKAHPVWGQFFIDSVTGIEAPLAKTGKNPTYIYNVSGQRLNKMQKGINIKEGKKIILHK